jgi:hypothetical protein
MHLLMWCESYTAGEVRVGMFVCLFAFCLFLSLHVCFFVCLFVCG